MQEYQVTDPLTLPEPANPRFGDLSQKEVEKGRCIGGGMADLVFSGYEIANGATILTDPKIITTLEGLRQEEINDIAYTVLWQSYESVGIETVEHS
jgi:hypothetical protein